MEEQLVSFETAIKAKEKGFDILIKPVYAFDNWDYNEWRCFKEPLEAYNNSDKTKYGNISAPTQSLLQKWLREIHKIDIYIQGYGFGYYAQLNNVPPANQGNVPYIDRRWNMPPKEENSGNLRTYEQALEVGLQQALNLINNGTDTNNS